MTAAACEDCTRATAGIWCGYRGHCHGCIARSIARSLAAFNAWHPKGDGDAQPLRELAVKLLPTRETRAEIRRWWDIDHPAEQITTTEGTL
jgi:adenosylmethionine-8-amino-7-oxononanoate aminotransferase